MKSYSFKNLTHDPVEVSLRDTESKRVLSAIVVGHGVLELTVFQLTPDAISPVAEGILEAVDMDTGERVSFAVEEVKSVVEPPIEPPAEPEVPVNTDPPAEPEVPVDTNPPADPEPQAEPEAPTQAGEFECDICHQKFESARGLAAHKRSHK